jgi:ketosteroid isomerase-like protein
MSTGEAREQVLGFLRAIYARDVASALTFLDDEFDFVGHVPVEIFPHLGARHGKPAIAETLEAVQQRYASMHHEVMFIAADCDKVATIIRVHLRKRDNDRVIEFLIADFYTLRSGLIVEQRQFLDSFDLVQQVLEREVIDDIRNNIRARMTLAPAE